MRSMSGLSAKRTAMAVPPEKSMPNFRPFCTNTAKMPSAMNAQETRIARHL